MRMTLVTGDVVGDSLQVIGKAEFVSDISSADTVTSSWVTVILLHLL